MEIFENIAVIFCFGWSSSFFRYDHLTREKIGCLTQQWTTKQRRKEKPRNPSFPWIYRIRITKPQPSKIADNTCQRV